MEPVREQILNLQHISYTYHTLQGGDPGSV